MKKPSNTEGFQNRDFFTSTSKHSNVDEVNSELLNLNKQNWSQVLDVILDFEMPLWIVQIVSVQSFLYILLWTMQNAVRNR